MDLCECGVVLLKADGALAQRAHQVFSTTHMPCTQQGRHVLEITAYAKRCELNYLQLAQPRVKVKQRCEERLAALLLCGPLAREA